jgi:tRNA(Leu) C34 or U34 (ribose-2'-O)-methylase TrmL
MPNERIRSLNLATSVGIVLYEALRQLDLDDPVPADRKIRERK